MNFMIFFKAIFDVYISYLASFDRSKCLAGVCPCTKFSGHSPLPLEGHCMRLNLKDFPLPLHQRPTPTMPGALFFLLVPNQYDDWTAELGAKPLKRWPEVRVGLLHSFLFCQHVRVLAVANKERRKELRHLFSPIIDDGPCLMSLLDAFVTLCITFAKAPRIGWFEKAAYSHDM